MKNNFLSALLLLSIVDASAVAMASPQAISHNHKSLFQLTEVSPTSSFLISEKGDAKCGAGACGATKKSKPAEKKSEQKSTEKQHDKTKNSDSKCGAGACGSTKAKNTKK